MQRVRTFRYVVHSQVADYVRNGWVVSATFPSNVHHSQYSIIMEKEMAVRNDEPFYHLACLLGDVQHTIATMFSLSNGTVGKDMTNTLLDAKEEIQRINNLLIDVIPHLEEIKDYSYADEQRNFEEMKEQEGQKPEQHIFYALEALDDFITEMKYQD